MDWVTLATGRDRVVVAGRLLEGQSEREGRRWEAQTMADMCGSSQSFRARVGLRYTEFAGGTAR